MSYQLDVFCKEARIKRSLTAPRSPQQNRVVERRNKTILEMSRAILLQTNLPKEFWGEVSYTAVHLLNRAPSKAASKSTPFELLHKRKPSGQNYRVIGCTSFILKPKGGKLNTKAEKVIFDGYDTHSKTYSFIHPGTKKLIIARDAVFNENEA